MRAKEVVTKPDSLILITGTHREKRDCCKLSFDIHTGAKQQVSTPKLQMCLRLHV